ncbi:hypothetical protein [Paenibacillus polymyxa]|uniref:hypothetical protein n=1 Tax=Paenibacillus polymyxa TaxID=1406 RepID=UPI001C5983CB|nr:hypothetical protein [Paenibacillus polymyxa]
MSVCVVVIEGGGNKLHIAAESRVIINRDGEYFHSNDDAKKLQKYPQCVAYVSGAMILAEEVSSILNTSPIRTIDDLSAVCQSVYNKYILKYPPLKEMKYILKLVMPVKDENGKWCILYMDDVGGFDSTFYGAYDAQDYVFTINSSGEIIRPYIEARLGIKKMDELFMLEAFSEAVGMKCGGTLTHFVLYDDGLQEEYYNIIKDTEVLKKWSDVNKLQVHGEGDGGPNGSGIGWLKKPNGSIDFIYHASNTAKNRSVRLMDDGVFINSEEKEVTVTAKDINLLSSTGGATKLGNSLAYIECKSDGTMVFHAKRFDFNTD